jgi:hypothetical protein
MDISVIVSTFFNSYSQQSRGLPLDHKTIEGQYNVKFSYAVADVQNIAITPPASTLTFKETIAFKC